VKEASGAQPSSALPGVNQLADLILDVLRGTALGTANVGEMHEAAVQHFSLDADQVAKAHDPRRGRRTELSYRLAWGRTLLKNRGLVEQAARGTWRLTEAGKSSVGKSDR